MSKKQKIIYTIGFFYFFVSTLIIAIIGIVRGASSGQLGEGMIHLGYFKAFTNDSNIFLAISGLISGIYFLLHIFKGRQIPKWVVLLYFVATSAVALTFFTVIFILLPEVIYYSGIQKAYSLFAKEMFFFHVVNPILAMVIFIFYKDDISYGIKENFIGIVPMFIYSIVYLICVVFAKVWEDFYGFTVGGRLYLVPLVMLVLYAFAFGISKVLIVIKNKKHSRNIE